MVKKKGTNEFKEFMDKEDKISRGDILIFAIVVFTCGVMWGWLL